MNVGDLGEFELIARLRALLPPSTDRLIVGPGDDGAVWRSRDGYTIATTDTMVAGVHFLPELVNWRDVGWKALAANVSDIAAMGGTPAFALVTLQLPPATPVARIDALYAGLRECAATYNVAIAGGDVVSAPVFAITIALTGDANVAPDGTPLLLRRDAARVGDVIAVTYPLGASAGGLRALLAGGVASHDPHVSRLIEKHMRPQPSVYAGHEALRAGIRCAIDISDGLVQDIGHVCTASGVGAEIILDRVPIDHDLLKIYPDDARRLALIGGEGYELVLVGSEALIMQTSDVLDDPLTIAGRIVEGAPKVRVLDASSAEVVFDTSGWDHFDEDRHR